MRGRRRKRRQWGAKNRTVRLAFAAAAFAFALATPALAATDPARYMPAELIAQSIAPKPGSTILVGFRMTPKSGWHGYWSNPGDSGIAPSVAWTAPTGVKFGPLLHPAPTLISADGISSYVHEGRHILLSRMTIPGSLARGEPIPIEAKLSWAACTETQCVPLHATFTLALVAGDGARGPDAEALENAGRELPRPASGGDYSVDGNVIELTIPKDIKVSRHRSRFFPDENDAFQTIAAHASGDGDVISAPFHVAPRNSITGVLTDGRNSYRIAFSPIPPPARSEPQQHPPGVAKNASDASATSIQFGQAERQTAHTARNDWRWPAWAIVLVAAVTSGLALLRRRKPH